MNVNGIKMCVSCMHPLDETGGCTHCGFNQSEYKQIPCCLSPGTMLSKRYVVGKVLGEGSFGITYIGWDTLLECVVAVKEYFPIEIVTRDVINGNNDVYLFSTDNNYEYKEKLEKFLKEARCLTKFNQLSGVVSVRDFFYENETAYIVMEYVSGCSVKSYIQRYGKMDGKKVISLMKPVMNALDEIHKSGIVHRDISPDNMLFSEKGELVLIDFGASRLRDIDMMKSMTVTFKRGFSPEEQYRSRGILGAWTDVYSVCATMYYMLTGNVPIESVERIVGGRLQSLIEMNDINISAIQKKALMKGLSVEAKDRYQTVSQLYADIYNEERIVIAGVKKSKKLYVGIGLVLLIVIMSLGLKLFNNNYNNKISDEKDTVTGQTFITELPKATEEIKSTLVVTAEPVPITPEPLPEPTPVESYQPSIYKMVSVVGMTEEKAKKKIKEIGSETLKIKIKRIYDTTVEKNIVIKQSVKKGESWQENEKKTIILYVSKGIKKQNNTANNTINNNTGSNNINDVQGEIFDENKEEDVIGTIP